eukprot:GGOE01065144.1.p2 GENE.GGOE01065144.1~~GGOE01065144.1.p2  ORF type:complete len:202 (+),score=43.30 GGOE01065144.1:92-697(+)
MPVETQKADAEQPARPKKGRTGGLFAVDLEDLSRGRKRKQRGRKEAATKKARTGLSQSAHDRAAENDGSFLAHMLDEEEFTIGDSSAAERGGTTPGFVPPPLAMDPSSKPTAERQPEVPASTASSFAFPPHCVFQDVCKFSQLFRRHDSCDDIRKAFDRKRAALRSLCERLRTAAKAGAVGAGEGPSEAAEAEPTPLPPAE